jgi:hypothetical protein
LWLNITVETTKTMLIIRCILGTVGGWFLGLLLFIPGCLAATIVTQDVRRGETIANNISVWVASLGAVIGFIIPIVSAQRAAKEATKRREAEAAAQAAEEQRQREAERERQRQYLTSLVDLGSRSFALFEDMPTHLLTTEELLDQAESNFVEEAFAPFWDSVERAAMQLGHFDDCVRTITANAERHTDVAKDYEGTPPPFPIILDSVTGMAVATTTADRMKAIVRKAQRNFQFAMIFEQRKTNQLLVAGFTNLAQALDGMGSRIESSIDDLGGRISEMSSTLDKSFQSVGSNLKDTLKTMHTSIEKDAAHRAERHERALTMLDNIQRRRKPIL